MIDRRKLLCGGLALAGATPAAAALNCVPHPAGRVCTAEVDLRSLQPAVQARSQWCWAACIAMLFAHHRHPVAQERIVAEAYGGPVDLPASPFTMSTALNRDWIDDRNQRFSSRLGAVFDAAANVSTIDNGVIARALAVNTPLIVGTGGHAMVITAIQYLDYLGGMQVGSIGVFDPWPGRGLRGLSPAEMMPVGGGGLLNYVVGINVW